MTFKLCTNHHDEHTISNHGTHERWLVSNMCTKHKRWINCVYYTCMPAYNCIPEYITYVTYNYYSL